MNKQEIDKFIEEVEREKEKLSKCGWQVQDHGFITRAVNIINALRAKCEKCTSWKSYGSNDPDGEGDWGECRHEKINNDDRPEDTSEGQLLAGGGHEGYGDFLKMHKDFGCVCFEAKSEPEKQEDRK